MSALKPQSPRIRAIIHGAGTRQEAEYEAKLSRTFNYEFTKHNPPKRHAAQRVVFIHVPNSDQ